jgi:hypothetical protein
MRKILLALMVAISGNILLAQNTMHIHKEFGIDEYIVTSNDSIYFSDDDSILFLTVDSEITEYLVSEIDSITFTPNNNTIFITYSDNNVEIINPFEGNGVDISVDIADVIVTSTTEVDFVNIVLSGYTSDGMFKIYSDKDFNLLLNNIDITNSDGPAINIQDGGAWINLVAGTENILTDGLDYAAPIIGPGGDEEDQKAALFSEDEMIFIGSGELTVNGYGSDQSALRSDDYLQFEEGEINIASAVKDGIHGKEGITINGGTLNVEPTDKDGIDADEGELLITGGSVYVTSTSDDVKAIKSSNNITISGGSVDIDLYGDKSKGIDSDTDIGITGGNIHILAAGGVVLEASGSGYDPSYCSAINTNTNIYIGTCTLQLETTGEASRGIASDGNVTIDQAVIDILSSGDGDKYTNIYGEDDAYHGSCINVDGDLNIIDGDLTISNSGSGGKGITVDGNIILGTETYIPVISVTTSGEGIEIEPGGGPHNDGEYDEAKAIKSDANITINNTELSINSADDAIKADTSITLINGVISIEDAFEGFEAPNITISGGNIDMYCSDDGFNATYGNGGEQNDGSLLLIEGGYSHISSTSGDPLDSNGDFTMNGGTVVVHGPQSSPEVGIDVNGTFLMNDGFLVVSGTNSNMTEGPSNASDQYNLLLRSNQQINANTIFHIEDSNGNDIVTFKPRRRYYSIVFSSDELTSGETYSVYTGGTSTGTVLNGLYSGGTYSGGTFRTSFTISNIATQVWF